MTDLAESRCLGMVRGANMRLETPMKSWLVGCTVAAILGVACFLVSKNAPVQAPIQDSPVVPGAVAAAVPEPPAPVIVLDRVVETADIDSLLDPPAIPRTAARTIHEPMLIQVGFERPTEPAPSLYAAPPIPPARDFDKPIVCSEEEVQRSEPGAPR